jgi:hypothetical protein
MPHVLKMHGDLISIADGRAGTAPVMKGCCSESWDPNHPDLPVGPSARVLLQTAFSTIVSRAKASDL